MKLYISILILFFAIFSVSSCVKDDQFGKSDLKKIIYYTLKGQVGVTNILNDSLVIEVVVPNSTNITALFADSVQLTSYANLSPAVGTPMDCTLETKLTVTAEDGSTAVYKLRVKKESLTPQLDDSDFKDWYLVTGKNYQEPGSSATTTIWATGNAGVVTLGQTNAVPITIEGKTAVQLKTVNLPLGQLLGQGMAVGTIFTGKFELNISKPLESTKFGIPFVARPKGFSIKYTYQPGQIYKNGYGATLTKTDSCDMYVLLENKQGTSVKRIATAWFRDGKPVNNLTEMSESFVYGQLPAGTPGYRQPANGFGNANDEINQITVVMSSSANGALFEGGVGSTLIATDFNLIY